MNLHKDLSQERWFAFSFMDQMANVGTDFERALDWRKRGDIASSDAALWRGLELLAFTLRDPKNKKRRTELARIKECILDYFYGDNQYGFTDDAWHQYFYCFAYAAAMARRR
jgi:hypothetical protein